MTSTDDRLAELEQKVESLTTVVAALTETRLFDNSGRHFPKKPVMFDELGLRGPAQARKLMEEQGLL